VPYFHIIINVNLTILFLYFSLWYFFRFFIFAIVFYVFFWRKKNSLTEKLRIQHVDFTTSELKRDLTASALTCALYGLCLMIGNWSRSDFLVYVFKHNNFGLKDFILTVPLSHFFGWFILIVLVHETYAYWVHRLFHTPFFYKHIHYVHHTAKNPNPFTTHYFHPIEAVVGVLWVIALSLSFKIPLCVWIYFSFVNAFINVLGHSGIEIFPSYWKEHWFFKFLNSSTNHNHHHKYSSGNYGFYFTFWDRAMNTFIKN